MWWTQKRFVGLAATGAVLLVVAVVWRRLHGAPRWMSGLVAGGTGAALALLGALALKVAIGRSQIYPSFLLHHVIGGTYLGVVSGGAVARHLRRREAGSPSGGHRS